MKYLIVVAHPDDEVLGAGASIYKWARNGNIVNICVMNTESRACKHVDKELDGDSKVSSNNLGIFARFEGTFSNIEMNTISPLKLVKYIEGAIRECEPDIIITHHPADTNNGHKHTSMACKEAVRLYQKRPEENPLKEFWYMEMPSCMEWPLNTATNQFQPNTWVEVNMEGLDVKIRALGMHSTVVGTDLYHSNAEEIVKTAAFRGCQAGCDYAEAFEVVMRKI